MLPGLKSNVNALFLDRDGVVNELVKQNGLYRSPRTAEEFRLIPGLVQFVRGLKNAGYLPVIVSNQPEIARGLVTRETVDSFHGRIEAEADIHHFYVCYHDNDTGCDCRKPKPGLIFQAAADLNIDLHNSVLVGDREKDMMAAQSAGVQAFLWGNHSVQGYENFNDFRELAGTIVSLATFNAKTEILGVNLYSDSLSSAVAAVVQFAKHKVGKPNRCISATGAHGLVVSRSQPYFHQLLNSFCLNLPDGMPAVWLGKLKGARKMQRCYGPVFFELVMRYSASTGIKHFLCGGKDGVADELRRVCELKFSNVNCVGTFSPPFRQMSQQEFESLGNRITLSNADIVWIGLSTPKQEFFAATLAPYVTSRFIVTVGAAFDFHTGRVKQAPKVVQTLGMEWLFRLLMEPRRLWKRYFTIVPLFIYYNLIELLNGQFFVTKTEEDYSA